ncbi:MAG: hypothetical protein V3T31_07945, partial [candidate division Zixibacteria bacterium]
MTNEEKIVRLATLAKESAVFRSSLAEELAQSLIELGSVMSGVIGSGGRLMIAGNGVLAGLASAFVADMVVRSATDRNRQGLPVMSLSSDATVMSAAIDNFGSEY